MNSNYPLVAYMVNQFNRVDVVSNNLANANTNGFKQEHLTEGTFNNYLTKKHSNSPLVNKMNTINNNIPKINGEYKNNEMGPIQQTGNEFDYALRQNDTFFKVQNPNGEVEYTRDGSFKIVNNLVVTANNWPVLNADDTPIEVEVGADIDDQLGIVKTNFANLEKIGNNNFRAINQNLVEAVDGDNLQYIAQGMVEKSNINPVNEMVALIDAHRRLENAQKAMYSLSEMSSKLLEKLGTKA